MDKSDIKFPCLNIYVNRIKNNARSVTSMLAGHNISCFGVTKVLCGEPEIGKAMLQGGCAGLADSRIENIRRMKKAGLKCQFMLLRIPMISQARDVVETADFSLVSQVKTAAALDRASGELNTSGRTRTKHGVILMVDLGDLREGVWPPENGVSAALEIEAMKNIFLAGIGVNMACYGGIVPDSQNMDRFNDIVTEIQNRTGRALMIVSGGNSSGLAFASKGLMPGCVNSFRVGETIILGRDVYDRSPFENTVQNTVEIGVEIVELMVKPSVPIGTPGQDAFGNVPVFTDKGPRLRAICAIGKQDTDLDNIRPLIKGAQVLGGSSDHLIVDLTQCTREFKTGDVLFFEPSYSALLAASTSPYVEKRLIYQTGKQCEV